MIPRWRGTVTSVRTITHERKREIERGVLNCNKVTRTKFYRAYGLCELGRSLLNILILSRETLHDCHKLYVILLRVIKSKLMESRTFNITLIKERAGSIYAPRALALVRFYALVNNNKLLHHSSSSHHALIVMI